MAIPKKVFGQLAEAILEAGAVKATKFISSNEVVKATIKRFGPKRIVDRRSRTHTLLFTVGAPNYAEREFIKKCVAEGRRLPTHVVCKFPRREASYLPLRYRLRGGTE